MKRTNITLIIAVALLCLNSKVFSQDGLILPMPGQKPKQTSTEVQKPSQPAPKTQNTNSDVRKTGNSSGVIIPLPQMNKNSNQDNKPKQEKPVTVQPPKQEKPVDVHNEPLIVIPPMDNKPKNKPVAPVPPPQPEISEVSETPKPTDNNSTMTSDEAFLSDFSNDIDDFPSPDGQITSSPNGNNVENILPPAEADTTVAQDSSGEKITIYPKDSGSAIFMVMKSWQCNDYDAASLINQALEVYGKDSAEPYQINGLENIAKGTTVSVEEEDITFDELLDILGSKTGNDWGCDITNKTIYIYPKGIKTESYVSWE
jgi:hypothetical protein